MKEGLRPFLLLLLEVLVEEFEFIDALTGDTIGLDPQTGQATLMKGTGAVPRAKSVFYPGCSLINYGMPLVKVVYDTLRDLGEVDGISVLCCGKILSYEPDGDRLREAYDAEMRDTVAALGIERFVCACPNCVKALREALRLDPRTSDVGLAILPQVLADAGYRLDPATCGRLVKGDESSPVLFSVHDSCPDREYGDFARGLRAIIPEGMWVDPPHSWKRSVCCGSLPRAAGKFEQADKCADLNGREAVEVEADAIITACMSCDFQLNMAQPHVQCVHFLEMLYGWRVDWAAAGQYMKLRFLFNDTLGALEKTGTDRRYEGLRDVSISDENVADLG